MDRVFAALHRARADMSSMRVVEASGRLRVNNVHLDAM
jgi:hypothetical protein